jgi:hypothetical protein
MSWKYRNDEFDFNTASGIDMALLAGGVRPSPRNIHTGGNPAQLAADGNNSTPVITEIYLAEIFVPFTVLATGIAVFNGSDATDSVKCALYDANGTLIRATADTQVSGTDAYQRHAFATGPTGAAATTVDLIGPGTYYIGCIYDGTTSRFNTHAVGNFGAGKLTGHVYATAFISTALSGLTMPTTFTTALGPIASLY